MKKRLVSIISALVLLTSCGDFSFSKLFSGDEGLLASVGDDDLYLNDIQSIFTPGMSPEDSLAILNAHVDMWIKTTIKRQEAEKFYTEQQDDIEELIEAYRNSLLTHKYDQELTNNADTIVTDVQIKDYYQKYNDNLVLMGPIVKARVVRYPTNYRQERKLRELIQSIREQDYFDLKNLVKKSQLKYDEFVSWTYFKDVLNHIPFSEKSFDSFLRDKSFYEVGDDEYSYMMVIMSYKNSGDKIPMEMVTESIRRSIISQRRGEIIKSKEDSLYNDAIRNEKINIYIDTTERILKEKKDTTERILKEKKDTTKRVLKEKNDTTKRVLKEKKK